jgi:hypothetical protein
MGWVVMNERELHRAGVLTEIIEAGRSVTPMAACYPQLSFAERRALCRLLDARQPVATLPRIAPITSSP